MLDFIKSWFYWWLFGIRIGWWKFRYHAAERSLLLVRQGVYYDLLLTHRIYQGKMGDIYACGDVVAYVYNDFMATENNKRSRDNFEVYEDERILFMVDGEVVTSPVKGTGVAMEADILSKFNQGNWGKQLADSIREPGTGLGLGNLKWLLLIIGIAIILFVIWKFVLHGWLPGVITGNETLPLPTPTSIPSPTRWPVGG